MWNVDHFYNEMLNGLVEVIDNIPKPIADTLKGLVYLDDEQVTDVSCRKRNLNSNLRIENPSSVLAEGFSRGNQFLYIVVEEAPNQEAIY
jgi:crossover junction endodeoxyribonuclease RusA